MQILVEVSDILGALLADRSPEDPTFQRMVSVYRDVTALLGCLAEYELMLRGLLALPSSQHPSDSVVDEVVETVG